MRVARFGALCAGAVFATTTSLLAVALFGIDMVTRCELRLVLMLLSLYLVGIGYLAWSFFLNVGRPTRVRILVNGAFAGGVTAVLGVTMMFVHASVVGALIHHDRGAIATLSGDEFLLTNPVAIMIILAAGMSCFVVGGLLATFVRR